jgi:glycine/D-amino acid oxidase-like deaminating enzyme
MAAPDVVVIGGGIVGVAAATFLAEGGARVTLVEREALAAGASGRNSGVIQRPFDPALVPLYDESLAHYRDLAAAVPEDGFRLADEPAGLLLVSHDEAVVRGRAAQLRDAFPDLPTEVLGGADLTAREPAIADGVWALHVPIGYPVVPSAPTYAWAARADRAGVAIRLGREATPAIRAGRIEGVDVAGERIAAAAVVVAAGPWSAAIVDPTGRWRPIRPSWGVVVETVLPRPPRHVLEEAAMDEALGVEPLTAGDRGAAPDAAGPRPETSVVTAAGVSAVGSTFLDEEPDLDAWTEPILRRATTFVPALLDAPIRETRACARPQSADGRPLVGAMLAIDGLSICAGHGPWGITTGPASARMVADLVLGRPVVIAHAFDPMRFGTP